MVTVHRLGPEGPTDYTPDETWVTAYLLQWGLDIDYAVRPSGDDGVAFRLDLRRVFFPGDDLAVYEPVFLSYQVLGEDGAVLAAGDVSQDAAPSRYDMATGAFADCRISRYGR